MNAAEQIRGGDFPEAREVLDEIVDGSELDRVRPNYRLAALSLAVMLAYQDGELQRAHALGLRVTAMQGATASNWRLLVYTALQSGDPRAAVRALTTLAERWPEQVAATSESAVLQVVRAALLTRDGDIRLLTALFNARWQLALAGEPSEAWREFALLLLERGDTRFAKEVAQRIVAPESLIQVRADARFDALRQAGAANLDVASAAVAQIDRLRSEARSTPDLLEPIVALAAALAENNRCTDALEVVDEALARAASQTAEGRPFRDGGRFLGWLLDERARRLACLGRWDEAVRQRVQASQLTEFGERNTSQTINLAHLYATVGRPVDALAALEAVGQMSDYGKMEEQWARLRAHVQLGNQEGVGRALAYLREHRGDGIDVYQQALVDAGEMDSAAALLMERLARPDERAFTLGSLQRYAESPSTPVGGEHKARWDALVARPDVRGAIDRVGRIESYPFMRPRLSVE